MKNFYTYLACAASISALSANISKAQTSLSPALPLKAPAGTVTIDGSGTEWGDTLSYYNAEKKVRYTIANDKDKLYLVVKTKDPVEESNILAGGLTFTIDPKGKKRNSFTTTFPSNGDSPAPAVVMVGDLPMQQKLNWAKFSRFKKITVSGFRDINEDFIPAKNAYDIEVAVNYDEQGFLVYEEAIPISLFHPGDLIKTEWSFNIKLNGLEKSSAAPFDPSAAGGASSGGGRGGGGKGGHKSAGDPSTKSTGGNGDLTPTIDFWGRFSLAK